MYLSRLQKIQQALKEQDSQGMLVSSHANIFYISGFMGVSETERESSVFITPEKAYLFLPAMYESQGKSLAAIKDQHIELIIDQERDYLLTKFSQIVSLNNEKPVFFEGYDLRYSEYECVKSKLKNPLQSNADILPELRICKSEEELELIKKAVEITDKTYENLLAYLKNNDYTQLTELEVADQLKVISRQMGGEGFGFDPIVACGPGSAEPHYHTSNKKLSKDQLLLMDFGIKYQGYSGDLTRCVYLGEASEECKKVYNAVLQSNQRSLDACKAGITTGDLYNVANDSLKEQDLSQYFLHGLGHGIGIEVHEKPYLRSEGTLPLKPNMVVTIEPGVYLNGKFGVRIEDYVVVTENGCSILSQSPKENLVEIK